MGTLRVPDVAEPLNEPIAEPIATLRLIAEEVTAKSEEESRPGPLARNSGGT